MLENAIISAPATATARGRAASRPGRARRSAGATTREPSPARGLRESAVRGEAAHPGQRQRRLLGDADAVRPRERARGADRRGARRRSAPARSAVAERPPAETAGRAGARDLDDAARALRALDPQAPGVAAVARANRAGEPQAGHVGVARQLDRRALIEYAEASGAQAAAALRELGELELRGGDDRVVDRVERAEQRAPAQPADARRRAEVVERPRRLGQRLEAVVAPAARVPDLQVVHEPAEGAVDAAGQV